MDDSHSTGGGESQDEVMGVRWPAGCEPEQGLQGVQQKPCMVPGNGADP